MTDIHSKEQRSRNMSAIRGKGNKSTELALVKLMRLEHITGWRRHFKRLSGTPDFVFPKKRLVIFLDGCFWHGCKKCGLKPKTNREFWNAKIKQNIERDKKVNKEIKSKGWKIIRVWEHNVKKNPDRIKKRIISLVL